VCAPKAFYVYVFSFFFFVFLQHYPTDHPQSLFSFELKSNEYIINNSMSTFFLIKSGPHGEFEKI